MPWGLNCISCYHHNLKTFTSTSESSFRVNIFLIRLYNYDNLPSKKRKYNYDNTTTTIYKSTAGLIWDWIDIKRKKIFFL